MTNAIIITLCVLLLLAYIFDISSARTRIPSVILLLLSGLGIQELVYLLHVDLPNLKPVLPFFGNVGLVLIVLEGSFELDFDRSKLRMIGLTSLLAFLPIIIFSFLLAFAFQYFSNVPFKTCLINAIPFSIISSAIAIPSVWNLNNGIKEFVTYETSLSDIIGVIFFNFVFLNASFGLGTFARFFTETIIILLISFVVAIILTFLLKSLHHHVKFTPIVIFVILIYTISKNLHLPALLFILLFGIFIGNLHKLSNVRFVKQLQPEILDIEVRKFKEIVVEVTFLIRSMFFLLFGFLLDLKEILNIRTLAWSSGITALIFLIRWLFFRSFKIKDSTLLYIAPRGLITILLFLSIPDLSLLPIVNNSLVVQVVILTTLMMTFGLMRSNKQIINETDQIEKQSVA